jgi:four helix bundle protein
MGRPFKDYRDLGVWQEAIALLAEIHLLVKRLPEEEQPLLGDQFFQAALAVPARIAQGQQSGDRGQFLRFLQEAGVRLSELEVLLITAEHLGFLSPAELEALEQCRRNVLNPLRGLIGKVRRDVAVLKPEDARSTS